MRDLPGVGQLVDEQLPRCADPGRAGPVPGVVDRVLVPVANVDQDGTAGSGHGESAAALTDEVGQQDPLAGQRVTEHPSHERVLSVGEPALVDQLGRDDAGCCAALLSVRRVTEVNAGRKTAGSTGRWR